jgi:transposase
VRVIKREKLACHKCPEGGVVTAAAAGPKIVEKGKLSDAVVVDVLIKKYLSHLPLYRQAADLHRDHGIDLSRSTLNAAVMAAGELLLPVAAVLKRDLLEGGYIQADETPIGVQSQQTKGRNHQAYEFQYSRPGGPVVFDFCMSRAREGPAEFLRDYGGILQCDGYQGYEKIGAPGIVRAGCLAHVRRKFADALKLDPQDREAAAVLLLMGKLYAVERSMPWKGKLARPEPPTNSGWRCVSKEALRSLKNSRRRLPRSPCMPCHRANLQKPANTPSISGRG